MSRVLAIAAAAAVAVVASALAQRRAEASAAARSLPGLPAYTAGYETWVKLNRAPIPPRRIGDAHSSTKNVYVSRRIRNGRYPYGTIIVKEGVRPGTRFVGLIAVMRKLRGSNPRHNDWVMIEWVRSGARTRFGEIARGETCTSCHVRARSNDYVFTRR